jgi:hypothetical protein
MDTDSNKSYKETHILYLEKMKEYAEKMTKHLIDGVESGRIPQYLYRFRSAKDMKEIISTNSLYFTCPQDLNDPYDTRVFAKIGGTPEKIRAILKEFNYNNRPDSELDRDAEFIAANPEKAGKIISERVNQDRSDSRICCFSKTVESMPMWAHYTENHKGFALKYDLLIDPYFFVLPIVMEYGETYPVLQFGEEPTSSYLNTKHKDWEYEKEVRVFKRFDFEEGQHHFKFDKNALVEIIFGYNSSDDFINSTMTLSKSNGYNAKFKKAQLKENEYGLSLQDLM